jgi:hypothetical protein
MASGTANSRNWKLRFERRSPPFVEPLMGWTGGDPKLSVEQKRNLLRQWALDAYRTEVATMDGMPPSASQLDEAIDALIDLDGGTASTSKRLTIRSATAGDRAQAA